MIIKCNLLHLIIMVLIVPHDYQGGAVKELVSLTGKTLQFEIEIIHFHSNVERAGAELCQAQVSLG